MELDRRQFIVLTIAGVCGCGKQGRQPGGATRANQASATVAAEPIIDAKSAKYNYTNEGGVGGTIRFLKNIIGLWVVQECRREWAKAAVLSLCGLTRYLWWRAEGDPETF